jgi:large repetitive protein
LITVTNSDPNAAADAEVTDDLPASLTFVSATPSQGTCNNADPIDCDLGTIAAAGQATVTVVATIGAGQQGNQISNTACAETSTTDPDDGNDCDDEQIDVVPEADLAITKTVDPGGPVRVGDLLTYELTITNDGPSAAEGVVVDDAFDAGVAIVSVTPEQGTCTDAEPIECELGAIPAAGQVTITVRARPLETGRLDNTATVGASTADTDPSDNEDDASVQVIDAKIKISKRANGRTFESGDRITYEIVVRSTSEVPLENVKVCDRLPRGLKLLSAPGAKTQGNRACWTVDLKPNGSRSFTVRAKAKRTDHDLRVINTATAKGPTVDAAKDRARVRVTGAGGEVSPEPCPVGARC